MLITYPVAPEHSYAAAERRARIRTAQANDRARADRAALRDAEPPMREVWAASLEKERRQEAAANRVRIARAVSRYSEANRVAMRAEASTYLSAGRVASAKKQPTAKASTKRPTAKKLPPRSR